MTPPAQHMTPESTLITIHFVEFWTPVKEVPVRKSKERNMEVLDGEEVFRQVDPFMRHQLFTSAQQ